MGKLNKKILLAIIPLLVVTGSVIGIASGAVFLDALKAGFRADAVYLAESLAANSLADVLTLNTPRLGRLIENQKNSNKDVVYIFVENASGEVLAHTFKGGFPVDLLGANRLADTGRWHLQQLKSRLGAICDVAFPIRLDNNLLGQVRVGIGQSRIDGMVARMQAMILGVTLGAVLLGILLAGWLSSLMTRRLLRLVRGIHSVKEGDFAVTVESGSGDEIDLLTNAFNSMTGRLKALMAEVETLTRDKERERIALDMHDGCAQHMVSLLRRIELCEKLLAAKSGQAGEELKSLKGTVEDILAHTRHVIFDLKSKEDASRDLSQKIRHYLKDYEKINGIAVEMRVTGPPDSFSGEDRAFYFCIVSEALNNVRKHSRAKHVSLEVDSGPESVRVVVRDDGAGFDVETHHRAGQDSGKYGLAGMSQRAKALGARLSIHSGPGRGTEVVLEIPLLRVN